MSPNSSKALTSTTKKKHRSNEDLRLFAEEDSEFKKKNYEARIAVSAARHQTYEERAEHIDHTRVHLTYAHQKCQYLGSRTF